MHARDASGANGERGQVRETEDRNDRHEEIFLTLSDAGETGTPAHCTLLRAIWVSLSMPAPAPFAAAAATTDERCAFVFERWIARFEKGRLKALGGLKRRLEKAKG